MTLKLFMAICILGLDVLIYILFQWALGEMGRPSLRRPKANRRLAAGQQETDSVSVPAHREAGQKRAKILHYPNSPTIKQAETNENWVTEEMAHRHRVRAFGSSKQSTTCA